MNEIKFDNFEELDIDVEKNILNIYPKDVPAAFHIDMKVIERCKRANTGLIVTIELNKDLIQQI